MVLNLSFAGRNPTVLVTPLMMAAVLIGSGSSSARVSTPSTSTCVSWAGLEPTNPGSFSDALTGVAVASPCRAWAVGDYSTGSNDRTLIEHWNGASWRQQTSPNPGGFNLNLLLGAAATSRTNAWAVGDYSDGTATETLVLHWNGANWKQAPSPNPSSFFNELDGVAATSTANAWVVGDYVNGSVDQTLIEHWNGTTWTQVSSPNPTGSTTNNQLYSVAATSSTNAWAVGRYFDGTAYQSLIEHWNGTAWTIVSSPNPGGFINNNGLRGVAAISSTDAWAVGSYSNGTTSLTLIDHWNGTAWKQVVSPNPGSSSGLAGVAAISSSDVWAVGNYSNSAGSQTLIENWNGTAWIQAPSPNLGGSSDGLDSVAGSFSTGVWAVGSGASGGTIPNQILAFHCC